MKKNTLFRFLFFLISLSLFAQKPQKLTSNQIYEKLQKLNFLGTALYIAAHPDDENTRLIAYLANKVKARTGYLSLTRGDGGQNLIGPEIRELLGVPTDILGDQCHFEISDLSVIGGENFCSSPRLSAT